MAVFNWDNKYIRSKIKNQKSKIQIKNQKFYSTKEKLDIWAEDIKIEKEWIYFKAFSKDGDSADFRVNLLGAQNIENILAAACVAKELGMSLKEISTASLKIKSWQSGIQLKKGKGGLNIIDATYSANPDGVISHLEYLKTFSGKKVIIMPCLIELGKASKKIHKRIGRKIAEVCHLAIITTKERFQDIIEGAIEKGMPSRNILFIENPKKIFKKIKNFCQPGDVILLESRVPETLIKQLIFNESF
jgi:UDP-N-acetylmuramoyl-tripeptide--D-alanyl-D-alanine ligase